MGRASVRFCTDKAHFPAACSHRSNLATCTWLPFGAEYSILSLLSNLGTIERERDGAGQLLATQYLLSAELLRFG